MRSKIALLVIVFAIEKTCTLSLAAGVEGNLEQDDLGGIIDQEEIVDETETTPNPIDENTLDTNTNLPIENTINETNTKTQPELEREAQTPSDNKSSTELNVDDKLQNEEDLLQEKELKELANANDVTDKTDGADDIDAIDEEETDEELAEEETNEELEEELKDTVPTGIEVVVVPFVILIILCIGLAFVFHNKQVEEDE
ncbi:hypothetical protein [Pseudobutyrivibrio ruminis]|uniref:hypothetical protein n=1 Tax=Pseudobutyrivibrio ruminis TaxID=46206 RepID=UPI00041679D9|nr:hypothetical protein [Pseudobutyrivibrio ruminis]